MRFRRRRQAEFYEVETNTGARVLCPDPRDAFAICSRELMLARIDLGHARSLGERQAAVGQIIRARMELAEIILEEYRGHLRERTRQLRELEAEVLGLVEELQQVGRFGISR